MQQINVVAKPDFIESVTSSSQPLPAISEIIWNGLDAGAENVSVFLSKNELDTIESISIHDDGSGIIYDEAAQLFGNLGNSWKKSRKKLNGRSLHGKNGRGRFKAFSLGNYVEWESVYSKQDKKYKFKITGKIENLDKFELGSVHECADTTHSGTVVRIYNPIKNFRSLKSSDVCAKLARTFAAYLTEYPDISIKYDGKRINPADVQIGKFDYVISNVELEDGRNLTVNISIIEWGIQSDRTIHFCDESGISLHEIQASKSIRAPGFNFSIYIKSSYFREVDAANSLSISEMLPSVKRIVDAVVVKAKFHFRKRLAEQHSEIVNDWKKEAIYPYEEKLEIGPIESAERQVFDIVAVNVQSYLPHFDSLDNVAKKFTFKLLAQALKQNPDSVRAIIGEVLNLTPDIQNELAHLLKRTTLESVIKSAKIVANRLDFLNGLEALVFNADSKKQLLERDQLHKILEKEAWIFHEEFSLSGSEQRLEEVLIKHLDKLGNRKDSIIDPVDLGDGKTGRVDLMLHKTIQPRTGEFDYLIVELKRPSQKINSDVLSQIQKYAFAIARDERFHGVKTRWTFMAISNEMDEYAQFQASQRGRLPGVVFEHEDLNITVIAKSWADIILDARTKLNFINQQLAYDATSDSAIEYLHKAHSKFIPKVESLQIEEEQTAEIN